jgi:hypothetical protein
MVSCHVGRAERGRSSHSQAIFLAFTDHMSKTSPPSVRSIVSSDYEVVGELASNVYIGGGFSGPEAEARLRDVSNWCREGRVLVAESPAGELIGCVALFPWSSSYATVAASGEVEVRLLAVSPAWRGAGAGAARKGSVRARSPRDECIRCRPVDEATDDGRPTSLCPAGLRPNSRQRPRAAAVHVPAACGELRRCRSAHGCDGR